MNTENIAGTIGGPDVDGHAAHVARRMFGREELELLNPYSAHGSRDPFSGYSYDEVCALHFPEGVKIESTDSGPNLEYIVAKPVNGLQANELSPYNPQDAVVMLAPFPNPISNSEGKPNHIALRGAAIADGTNMDVIAFGHPPVRGSGLDRAQRKLLSKGDYSVYAKEIARRVLALGKTDVVVYGYSQGGELVPDIAIALFEMGINVKGIVSAAPPGVIERSVIKLAQDFTDKSGMPTVSEEIHRLQSPAMEEATSKISSAAELAKVGINTFRSTSIAMGRGFSAGRFKDRLKSLLKAIPTLSVVLAASVDDKVCPIESLAEIADDLAKDGYNVSLHTMGTRIFTDENGKSTSNGHAWGDYISDQSGLVSQLIREIRLSE